MNGGPTGLESLKLAGSSVNPIIFLELLSVSSSRGVRTGSAEISGHRDSVYNVTASVADATSSMSGFDGSIVRLLGSFAGASSLKVSLWINSSGIIDQIQWKAQVGTRHATTTFAFSGISIPNSGTIAAVPSSSSTESLLGMIKIKMGSGGSSSPPTAPGTSGSSPAESSQPASTETCAEDQADGGTDAKNCPGTTTTSPGGASRPNSSSG